MIASDYLRCARSDEVARHRFQAIQENLVDLIDKVCPDMLPSLQLVLAERIINHFQLNCYYPDALGGHVQQQLPGMEA